MAQMTQKEIYEVVAQECGVTQKATKEIVDSFLLKVASQLAEGEKVQLFGFGTFEVRDRAARSGINPLTKEPMDIAAKKVPAFKPAKALKDAVDGK